MIRASDRILLRKHLYIQSKEKFSIIRNNVLQKKSHSFEKMTSVFKQEAYKVYNRVDPFYLTFKKETKFLLPSLTSRGETFGNQANKKFLLTSFPRAHIQKREKKKELMDLSKNYLKISFNFISERLKQEQVKQRKKTRKRGVRNNDPRFMKKFASQWRRQATKCRRNVRRKRTKKVSSIDAGSPRKMDSPMTYKIKKMQTQKYISKYKIGAAKVEKFKMKRSNTKQKKGFKRPSKLELIGEDSDSSDNENTFRIPPRAISPQVVNNPLNPKFRVRNSLSQKERKFIDLIQDLKNQHKNKEKTSIDSNGFDSSRSQFSHARSGLNLEPPNSDATLLFKKGFQRQHAVTSPKFNSPNKIVTLNINAGENQRKFSEEKKSKKSITSIEKHKMNKKVRLIKSDVRISKRRQAQSGTTEPKQFTKLDLFSPGKSIKSKFEKRESMGFFSKLSKKKAKGKDKTLPHLKLKKIVRYQGRNNGSRKKKVRKKRQKRNDIKNPDYLYNYSAISLYVDPRFKPVMQGKRSRLIKSFDKRA